MCSVTCQLTFAVNICLFVCQYKWIIVLCSGEGEIEKKEVDFVPCDDVYLSDKFSNGLFVHKKNITSMCHGSSV